MFKIYLDCDIILDWIIDRPQFSIYAIQLIDLIEKRKFAGYISPLVLTNSYYIIRKEIDKNKANEFLKDSKSIFNILGISRQATMISLNNIYKDFEDDIHYNVAIENKLDFLITRNINHYKDGNIKIASAEDFLIKHHYIDGTENNNTE